VSSKRAAAKGDKRIRARPRNDKRGVGTIGGIRNGLLPGLLETSTPQERRQPNEDSGMDRVTTIMSFVQVVDTGGFASAARALNLSPSMVTNHVHFLEERLGVRLLNRTTRKVNLTEVGQAYYERCVRILAELDEADHVAEALQSKPRGMLRLNTSPAMPRVIAPVIARFVALYPQVSVDIVATGRMVDLVEEGFDMAIRAHSIPDSSLIIRRLAIYRPVVCGAPEYLARHGTPARP
jgi:DNA-binding transcriptional LysR family regulator